MIRTTFVLALLGSPLVATCGEEDAASTPPPSPTATGRGAPGSGARPYDRSTEVTLVGVVRSVELVDHGAHGLHVGLDVDGEPVEVHLGPSWYAEEIGLAPAVGDRVTVTGARTGDVVLARELVHGERSWTLRDPDGLPAWRGRGRGRGPR